MRHHSSANDGAGYAAAEYRQRGATLVELAVAATVLAVLAVSLLSRLLDAQEYAERTAMELTVANMRAGLRAQVGALLMADRTSEIAALAGDNPVQWLDEPPESYLGEFRGQPTGDTRGSWYFDSALRELIYTANQRRHFAPSRTSGYTVRFKVVPIIDAGLGASSHQPVWVQLSALNDYSWF